MGSMSSLQCRGTIDDKQESENNLLLKVKEINSLKAIH